MNSNSAIVSNVSPKIRFNNAAKELRKSGVQFRSNVQECCRSCVTHEKLGMKSESQPYVFTYGGQGMRIIWDEFTGEAKTMSSNAWGRKRELKKADEAYVNWGNGSAQQIVDAFKRNGFDARWDGNDHSCVVIKF